MRHTISRFAEACLAASLLTGGIAGCESTTASDVAYEDAYAGDYYYPADVAVAGAYAVGWGYGLYYDTAAGAAVPAAITPVGGAGGIGSNPVGGSGGSGGSGSGGSGGRGGSLAGGGSVRSAVGQAIRMAASGADVCGSNATFTRASANAGGVCGITTTGFNLVFTGCALPGGGTVDGTVSAKITVSASDNNCTSGTTINVAYAGTITNLTYTGSGGVKVVIPSQTDMATIQTTLGTAPSTIAMMSTGEIQRTDSGGTTTSDRSFTGNRTFSSISFPNQTYTLDGSMNFTDKTGGGTATVSSMGLKHDPSCCKPTGGTISINRMGGNHSGSHTWTFSGSCGSATLDGKSVTLPACL